MKSFIKKLLREELHSSMKDDNWASYTGKPSYTKRRDDLVASIKSFTDITDDVVPNIVDTLGYEGHNNPEDAIEDLMDKINDYKKFTNPVVLYRVVAVKNKKLINTKKLGEHFTPYKWAIDGDMLMSIGIENWPDDWEPYIMEVSVPLDQIDVWQTLVQNLHFPNEHEVNVKNHGKGAKFIKAYKLYK